MANSSHTRCFAQTKYTNKEAFYSQIVGTIKTRDDGSWHMVDCDGNEIPFGHVMKKYEGKLVCINFNNLIVPSGNWDIEIHHQGN